MDSIDLDNGLSLVDLVNSFNPLFISAGGIANYAYSERFAVHRCPSRALGHAPSAV